MTNSTEMALAATNYNIESAKSILNRLFCNFDGCLGVRLWDGSEVRVGNGKPAFTLIFRSAKAFQDLVLTRHPLNLTEAYFQGLVDVDGDLYSAVRLRHYLTTLDLSVLDKTMLAVKALRIRPARADLLADAVPRWSRRLEQTMGAGFSKATNRNAISFHYDVSNEFYALWLDKQMLYSCAYYEHPAQTLEQAQCNKLDHICRKLRLQPGEQLLDIGCGWGALVCWAAEHYGAVSHGITLSRKQYDCARQTIKQRGLEGMASVELLDYRDLKAENRYDKLVSVGMFEHVGLKNLPCYFAVANRVLKPGGLFLNHGISSKVSGWKKTVGTEFINRYVFPDGQLETISTVQRHIEQANFEIHDMEGLRMHYALTLREWVKRLEARREEALRYVPESVYRVWRLYMTGCALQFEEGGMGLYQILTSRRTPFASPVPLTRRDLYLD